MELHEVGNMVQIGDKLIPAVNIQVENVPGFLKHCDGTERWYGVYFEIMFEDGSLWVVEQQPEEDFDLDVILAEYDHFAHGQDMDEPNFARCFKTWDEFVEVYIRRINRRAA